MATKKTRKQVKTDPAAYKRMLAKEAAEEMANPVTVGENFEDALAACKRNGKKGTYLVISFAPDPLCPTSQDPLFDDTITEAQMKSLFRFMEQNLAAPSAQPTELAKYQGAADQLAAFMEDENTPAGLRGALEEAVIDFVNKMDGCHTGIEVTRYQLARACVKAAAGEGGE